MEEAKRRLEEIGDILFGENGYFKDMPEDQKDAFGEGIQLLGKLAAMEVCQQQCGGGGNLKVNFDFDMLGDALKNFIKIEREEVYTSADEVPEYQNDQYYTNVCPTCNSNPCMCGNNMPPAYCGNCNMEPCMCANTHDAVCPKCMMAACMCTAHWEEPSMEMPPMPDDGQMELPLEEMDVDTSDMTYDPAMMPPMSGDTA